MSFESKDLDQELIQAVKNQKPDIELIKNLAKRASANAKGLALIEISDNVKIVDILIKEGADVNYENRMGDTPLTKASWVGNLKVISALIEAGADLDRPHDEPPIILALKCNNDETVRFLVEKGANINLKEFGSRTILDIYDERNNDSMINFLLENGAIIHTLHTQSASLLKVVGKTAKDLSSILEDEKKESELSKMDKIRNFHQKLMTGELKKFVKSICNSAFITFDAIVDLNIELLDFLLVNELVDLSSGMTAENLPSYLQDFNFEFQNPNHITVLELWEQLRIKAEIPKEISGHIDIVLETAKFQDDLRFNRRGAREGLKKLMESHTPLPTVVIEIITNYIIQNKLAEQDEKTQDKLTPEQQMEKDEKDLRSAERKKDDDKKKTEHGIKRKREEKEAEKNKKIKNDQYNFSIEYESRSKVPKSKIRGLNSKNLKKNKSEKDKVRK